MRLNSAETAAKRPLQPQSDFPDSEDAAGVTQALENYGAKHSVHGTVHVEKEPPDHPLSSLELEHVPQVSAPKRKETVKVREVPISHSTFGVKRMEKSG